MFFGEGNKGKGAQKNGSAYTDVSAWYSTGYGREKNAAHIPVASANVWVDPLR